MVVYRGIHRQEVLRKEIEYYAKQLADSIASDLQIELENGLLDSNSGDSI